MYPPASGPKYAPARFRLVSLFLAVALLALSIPQGFIRIIPTAEAASPNVVISQVYGGAGCTTAGCSTYKNDYIEIFNRGTSAVSLTGWSVQYASDTGNFNAATPLSGTLNPGQYYLVQEASNSNGVNSLPAADASGTIAMGATAGKVIVANTATALACGGTSGATAVACTPAQTANIIDLVGYGTSATLFEGGKAPAPSTSNAIFRAGSGCTDTDNNTADFSAAAASPRNKASAIHTCGVVTNNPPTITAPANPIKTVNQDDPPFTVNLTGNDDGGVYVWGATAGTGVSNVSVTNGQGTANVTYTVTLVSGFSGTATFTASLSDGVNPAATQAVNIKVNQAQVNNPPTITAPANPAATVEQDAPPFNVSLTGSDDGGVYNWSATAGTGVSNVIVSAGQGTANATFNVTLQSGFNGTATFTASLSDNVNPAANQAVNIQVNAPPPPVNHMVISQVYGGGGNSGATFRNDYVELFNPSNDTPFDLGGWTIQYASDDGSFWQAQPLGGVVQPGEYYLISLASGGTNGDPLPVQPNVSGGINMSATNGKVALVSGGDPLTGTCPLSDSTLVDLVGYGTSANCREGSTNAPGGSNTRAIFRKSNGRQDTNVNGSDFVTGAPNPRRDAVISEIGPYVLNVDPRRNASSAPRDLSVTVNFTESVDVTGAWYNIDCGSTGLHNDATVGGSGSFRVITPNVTFQPGEQCTATIFKNGVSDSDSDDGPTTNNLQADYTWSFTIATGTAPPYPPSVHLTMGNPNGATADINTPNNYLMEKPEYSLSYNRDRGTPNWVSWHLAKEWTGSLSRVDTFRPDPMVPADWYRVLHTDYFNSGFDRGHMTPNADRDPETSIPINQATFLMSNMIPQAPDNNQGPWAHMENALRSIMGDTNELYIVAGGAGIGGYNSASPSATPVTTIADGHVTVPEKTWKVALVLPKQDGDDVARVTCATRTIAVIMPNKQGIRSNPENVNDWQNYLTTVDKVEELTGYDFFSNVPEAVQGCIEAGVNGVNPPGTKDQSASTFEDTPVTITLEALRPNDHTPTFSIVGAGPQHGTLTGPSAASCDGDLCTATVNYTPAADYDGTDSFDFRASDGSLNGNVSTVSITITADEDGDHVPDADDNCPATANADQADNDHDGLGDACDADDDNDGQTDADETACGSDPLDANAKATDTDGDNRPDCVDDDDDNDGVNDAGDNCQLTANADQADNDGDNVGDVCDADDDNDGVNDGADNCQFTANADQADNDGDGLGDVCDADDDNDGVADGVDNCKFVANPDQANADGDAQGDVCDADDDNDGVLDGADLCPGTPAGTQVNASGCPDADGDGVADTADNCPFVSNADQLDTDHDGVGNSCDADDDGDGVNDNVDNCPLTPNPDQADFDHDGIGDTCDLDTGPPKTKEQCQNEGWRRFDVPWPFKNQGDCIQFVNTGK